MMLFDAYCEGVLESLALVLEDKEPVSSSSLYGRRFRSIIQERETFRTDKTGKKVKIPVGYSYKEGPNGEGVAVGPCDQVKVDRTGRLHAVPKGFALKIGRNGRGIVVEPSEPTRETKEGQIQKLKQPNGRV